jgi:hypothetical protein
VSDASDLSAIDPAPLATVVLGEGAAAQTVVVKALKLGKLPGFARALGPVSEQIDRLLAEGVTARGVMGLVEHHFDQVIDALVIATGATREALEESTIAQACELVLAVLQANRDFFRGRAATALRAAATISGAGQTPSKSSSGPGGDSTTSSS